MDEKKVIKFPNSPVKITGQTTPDPIAKLTVGPLSFHCTNCSEECRADFKKMIFRTIDFYCANCGNFFKVTNPGFTNPPKIKK